MANKSIKLLAADQGIGQDPPAATDAIIKEKANGSPSWCTIAQLIPSGGSAGQSLTKIDGTDYNLVWATVSGGAGTGDGDMLAATYDPQSIGADAFARANHTGTQTISTVSGLQSALDALLEAADIASGTITARTGAVDFSGGLEGYVWTVQADGSVAFEAPAAPAGDATSLRGVDLDASVATPSDGNILVYRTGVMGWGLETKPEGGANPALADITDVTITSVADNEILAFDQTSGWINQTAAEAGLATATQGATADTALQPADIASGVITARTGAADFSGGTTGHVWTVQADGSVAFAAVAGGGDMLAATYDPQAIAGDAFAFTNMTGQLVNGQYGTESIDTTKLQLLTITGGRVADATLSGGKLQLGAVSNARMSDMTEGTIKGRLTGTGSPQDLSADNVHTILRLARTATVPATLANSDSNRVFRVHATGTTTVPASGTLGIGFHCTIVNPEGSGFTRTIDGPGGTNPTIAAGETATINVLDNGNISFSKGAGQLI